MLGALPRKHLRALLARDHQCIHSSAMDGAERFLRFGQAHAEFREFAGLRRAEVASATQAGRRGAGGVLYPGTFQTAPLPFVSRSNPTIRPAVLDRLPMNRRIGRGYSLTSVGVAMI